MAIKNTPTMNHKTLANVTASWNPYSAKKIKNAPMIFKMVPPVKWLMLLGMDQL
jgi:hypothetical protein